MPLCTRRGLRRPASAGPRARRFRGLPPPARAGGGEWRRGQLACGRAGGGFVPRGRLGVRVWGSPRRRAGPEGLMRPRTNREFFPALAQMSIATLALTYDVVAAVADGAAQGLLLRRLRAG
jgi:hypothetical protein